MYINKKLAVFVL